MKASEFLIETRDYEVRIRRDIYKGPEYDGFLIEDNDGCVRVTMETLKQLLEAAVLLEKP